MARPQRGEGGKGLATKKKILSLKLEKKKKSPKNMLPLSSREGGGGNALVGFAAYLIKIVFFIKGCARGIPHL